MKQKIVLGTANFVQRYGLYAVGDGLPADEVAAIFATGISCFDTALAYGDCTSYFANQAQQQPALQVTTKMSVQDDLAKTRAMLAAAQAQFGGYAHLLLHDPFKLTAADTNRLQSFFRQILADGLVKRIGVSIYQESDLMQFNAIMVPQIIQLPCNPLNQMTAAPWFCEYVSQHQVWVQGRSLFLQGVLLADDLPKSLQGLQPLWRLYQQQIRSIDSKLLALLKWADQQSMVDQWVIGVDAASQWQAIIQAADTVAAMPEVCFAALQAHSHALVDPRNWSQT